MQPDVKITGFCLNWKTDEQTFWKVRRYRQMDTKWLKWQVK